MGTEKLKAQRSLKFSRFFDNYHNSKNHLVNSLLCPYVLVVIAVAHCDCEMQSEMVEIPTMSSGVTLSVPCHTIYQSFQPQYFSFYHF